MNDWKPGDVAMTKPGRLSHVVRGCPNHAGRKAHWHHLDGGWDWLDDFINARPLIVIDPEDTEEVERIWRMAETTPADFADALREFAAPKPPRPPADVAAVVTDRRENTWRLLADGDWVCTSGPDHGEYLNWDRLAAERGPLEVQS